jgi:cytochrome c-type biogenesis protein CcmH
MRGAGAGMRRAALLAAVLAVGAPGATLAQNCPQTTLGDIEDEVMCPVCGTPLGLATEAPQAQRQRAFIEEQIADCRSKDEIKRALVAQFGEGVLALPGDEGSGGVEDVLVYAIPALGIVIAAGGIAFAVVRGRRRRPGRPGPATAGADAGRLEDDMERYDL